MRVSRYSADGTGPRRTASRRGRSRTRVPDLSRRRRGSRCALSLHSRLSLLSITPRTGRRHKIHRSRPGRPPATLPTARASVRPGRDLTRRRRRRERSRAGDAGSAPNRALASATPYAAQSLGIGRNRGSTELGIDERFDCRPSWTPEGCSVEAMARDCRSQRAWRLSLRRWRR